MIWLFLLYVPALWLLWYIMQWGSKGRTTLSFGVLLFYACSLMAAPLVALTIYTIIYSSPGSTCTCEMVKNHECIKK